MKKNNFRILSLFLVFFLFISQAQAYWVWSPSEGKFISPESTANSQKTAEELFQSALKLREQKGKDREIIRLLQHVVKYHNQSAYAPEAQFLIAVIFEEQEKWLRAAAEFKKVVREFPRSQRIEEAIDHLFKTGNFFLTGEKQKIMGVAIIPVYSKAADIFKFIIEQAPYGPYGDQSQLKLGIAYRKMGSFNEAVNSFQALIANYPNSPLVDEAQYQLAETSYELSQNASRDQAATAQASLHLKDFINQYRASSLAERAELLKQRLDEQDAEKNYRIGLYYEKQGSIESALIYYEDVAARHAQTEFGKKAARRFGTLQEPIRAMEKGGSAIQQRIAEVRSMLEALERQESQEKGKKAVVSETADLTKQLKQELASLLIGQKEFKNEAKENFDARKRTLKQREKNLRQKFRTFKGRKKQLLKSPSPELQTVLDQWHASLVAEEEELTHERQALNEIKAGLKKQKLAQPKQKSHLLDWVPPRAAKIAVLDEKKWNKFQKKRAELIRERQDYEGQIGQMIVEFKGIQQQEIDLVSKVEGLDQLFPAELLKEKQNVAKQKSELDQASRHFEQTKKEFEHKFGPEMIQNLGPESNESYVSKSATINSLVAGGENLEQRLAELKAQYASLSESWLTEKEKFATMAKALDEGKRDLKQAPDNLAVEPGGTEDRVSQARVLKKRMKYLEREMRSRIDQIQDWRRENARRMKRLNQLLKPEGQSTMDKAAEKVLMPAKGTYKLTKAFLFGLENKEEKLMEQANAEIQKGGSGASTQRLAEMRELQEEIELQSILIQGRTSEIEDLETRLAELQKQAQSIPGFSYQSLLIERIPTDLAHTVDSAKKLMGLRSQSDLVQKRLKTQAQAFSDSERKITQLRDQIEMVNLAIEQKKSASPPGKAAVLPFVSGDSETLPQEGNAVPDNEPSNAQAKLVQMKADMDVRQSAYERAVSGYHEKLYAWYQTADPGKFPEKISSQAKKFYSLKMDLEERRKNAQAWISDLLKEESAVVRAQKEFTDQKLSELEAKLENLKSPSDSAYQALMSEIRNTQELRNSLIRDLSTLQSS